MLLNGHPRLRNARENAAVCKYATGIDEYGEEQGQYVDTGDHEYVCQTVGLVGLVDDITGGNEGADEENKCEDGEQGSIEDAVQTGSLWHFR